MMTVSLMQPADFKEINQWCIDEGWNIGLYDSDAYYMIDPLGHYIATAKERIASLSLIKHSPTFFTLGPFIVHKSYRGQGIGKELWNVAMTRMNQEHPDALITLYAVSAQRERYKNENFVPIMTIQRWYIRSTPSIPSILSKCTPLTTKLIPAISQYNRNHDIANRELLFKKLLITPEANGLVFMDDNLIKGFGFIRRCIRGFRIGALIADTPDIAQSIITELLVLAQGESVFIDVPECNPYGIACMEAVHAIRAVEEDTIMMVKGTGYSRYIAQYEHHYGLFSLEIG